jgi:hypothetical protein
MPKVLQSKVGYYFVDRWENVFTLRDIITSKELDACKAGNFWFRERTNLKIKEANLDPIEWHQLGSEEKWTELGLETIVYWAKAGSYRYVGTGLNYQE